MTDLHILSDPVNDFWKCLKKGFKKLFLGIFYQIHKKKIGPPFFYRGPPPIPPPAAAPPTPCTVFFYYHTNFCSNLKIFQFYHTFYHKFYHKPLPVLPSTPPSPQRFLYLRETQANVLRGLQRFWGGCKVLYLRETQANVCWLLVTPPPLPTTFSVSKRNTGKCFERPAKILRGMQSSVPKRNTGKCLLTVGTDVKNVTAGREGKGREGDQARFFMWIW